MLPIAEQAFTVVNEAGERIVETNTFKMYVGLSSEDKACELLVNR